MSKSRPFLIIRLLSLYKENAHVNIFKVLRSLYTLAANSAQGIETNFHEHFIIGKTGFNFDAIIELSSTPLANADTHHENATELMIDLFSAFGEIETVGTYEKDFSFKLNDTSYSNFTLKLQRTL